MTTMERQELKLFTREDFDRESADFFERLGPRVKEIYSGAPPGFLFLNNLVNFLPMDGASYRDMARLSEEMGNFETWQERKKIFEFIDRFFKEKDWDFGNVDIRNVKKEKLPELIELYCALRSVGFSHDELTR